MEHASLNWTDGTSVCGDPADHEEYQPTDGGDQARENGAAVGTRRPAGMRHRAVA